MSPVRGRFVAGPRPCRVRSVAFPSLVLGLSVAGPTQVSPVRSLSVSGPQAYCPRSALFSGTRDGDRPLGRSGVAGPAYFADLGHNSRGPGTQLLLTWDTTLTDRGCFSLGPSPGHPADPPSPPPCPATVPPGNLAREPCPGTLPGHRPAQPCNFFFGRGGDDRKFLLTL